MDRFIAMETFIRVVDAGSSTAAAKLLGVGQPAVSKVVAQLEERLGVRLLMRSPRGLTPTEPGQCFYTQARQIIERVDEAVRAARGDGAGLIGRLRVSIGATFASMHIVPRLPRFLAAHPNLSIDLVLHDGDVNLIEEGIDVALRVGTQRDSSLAVRKLATRPRLVLGTPAYFERAGTPRTPAELIEHAAVIYTQACGGNSWSFRRGAAEVSVKLPERFRVSAAEGVRRAVLSGIGLAVASEWMFAPELESGAVRPVLTEWTLPALDLWTVFPSARMLSHKARTFSDFVEAEFRRRPAATGLLRLRRAMTATRARPI